MRIATLNKLRYEKHTWLVYKIQNAQNFIYVLLTLEECVYDNDYDEPNEPRKPECG